jgi:uncharacterized repeat protein (TIGR01451 family)
MVGDKSGRLLMQLALALCAAISCGCAGLPRIDPSGERCLIWPSQQQAVLPPTTGNLTAPPVVTDPIFPAPPAVTPNVVPGAPAPVVPTVPFETLSMTPDRVLAPVGSEVILRTGICTRENYLLTCQKIDWLVARESAGQLVAVGGRGWFVNPVLPWNKGKKIDNNYGVGYTAHVDYTIDRGTENTADDVEIVSGQGWASFTSPVEGTSYITAVAEAVTGWPQRRAMGTIYWVDVQWEFPPAQISSSGSQVLSTIVRRQTDGTPLPGWVVRYEVLEGGGTLTGGPSNQIIEIVTGADGRASVEATPVGGSGNTTKVALQLVRPAEVMPGNMPRLVVANGASTITWNGGNSYLPPADNLEGTIPTYPIPGTSDSAQSDTPITPSPTPTQPSMPKRPVLDIEVRGSETGQVGGEARFEVIIRNTGDAEATGLVINDRFDAGLRHPGDNLGTRTIDKRLSATIPPGQSHTEYITFEIVGAGNLCHDVSVRSAQGADAAKRACINVPMRDLEQMPGMEVRKDGPRLSTVGETVLFTLSVKNTGAIPLTNVEVLDEYDAALDPRPRTEGYTTVPSNDGRSRFIWRIPRLEVGAVQRFEVDCVCEAPKQRACSIASVTAQGGDEIGLVPSADEHCMEIVESRTPGAGGAADVIPPADGGSGRLRLSIWPYNPKPIAGSRATYQFFIENGASSPDEQVQLSVSFPPELVPDMATVQADVAAQLVGNELQFNPVAMIRANERLSFTVTTSVRRAGIVNVTAKAVSAKFPTGVQKTEQVEIVGF